MRSFVRYNREGEILSVSRVGVMPEGLNQPYAMLGEEETVLEVSPEGEFLQLDTIQIHEGYKVDIGEKKLVKKT